MVSHSASRSSSSSPTSFTMAPPPPGLNLPITAFSDCSMSPQGVWSMVQHLRSFPPLRDQPEERLRAMAVAFLAFGGTSDGGHMVSVSALHPSHIQAHSKNKQLTWRRYMREEYIRMVMDLVSYCVDPASIPAHNSAPVDLARSPFGWRDFLDACPRHSPPRNACHQRGGET